jgi:guanine nucleotide-binding protein subunit alpha
MRLIHHLAFTPNEIEFFRQLVFANLTYGLKCVLDAADELDLALPPALAPARRLMDAAPDIGDGVPFPPEYHAALAQLWADATVQTAVARGNAFALPEKCVAPRAAYHTPR